MYSFYGGKQGRTYNLVERYDQIYIDQTKLNQFSPGQYEAGDRFTYESRIYLVLPQSETTTEKINLTVEDLKDDSKVIIIKGMVNEFQKGGAYTDANYGQYVIIDTILNQNHKNDDINGIIYRRGFDYNEPVVSYKRPEKNDQAQRTITQEIDGIKYSYTGELNVYHDYSIELNNNEPVPKDQGFNDDRWVAAWRKYILKPGGGAIYVGQIVGPQGDTPQVLGLSWEEFIKKQAEARDGVSHGIITMTDTPGWDPEKGYADNIKTGYCNIKDKDGNVLSDDGRMLDYQLAPDKTAFIYSYFTEDSSHNKDVSTCVPKNYEYTANNVKYDIDLVSKELEYEADDIEDKVDFSKANILSFEYISNKKSSDDYEVSLKVINNSNTPIPYCDYNMVYLDENENWLSDDSRMIDSEIQTGKYALTTSYAFPDNTNLIKKYWVYKYSYDLKSKDENGYVHYDVDLQRKIAIGSTEKEN